MLAPKTRPGVLKLPRALTDERLMWCTRGVEHKGTDAYSLAIRPPRAWKSHLKQITAQQLRKKAGDILKRRAFRAC